MDGSNGRVCSCRQDWLALVKTTIGERLKVPTSPNQIPPDERSGLDFDAIIVGAGLSGMYQLYRARELGLRVRVFEAGTEVGGTWYWNRYPGARFDSESYTYGYSFSKEVLGEWHWKERFSPQSENLRYLNFIADKFDLRRYMQFNARVDAATWDESGGVWRLKVDDGRELACRFMFLALGLLS